MYILFYFILFINAPLYNVRPRFLNSLDGYQAQSSTAAKKPSSILVTCIVNKFSIIDDFQNFKLYIEEIWQDEQFDAHIVYY